jgi:hypothetical protein
MEKRTSSGLRLAAVLLMVGAVAAGCGATSATVGGGGGATPLADFQNTFVHFRYPAAWKPSEFTVTGALHFNPMVYLSTQPTSNPCRKTGGDTVCTWPVARLRRDSVLVLWENRGYPGWSLASAPGTSLRIGGRPARRLVSRPGVCSSIGADETVQVAIGRPIGSNWTAFTACIRGPHTAAVEREVDAVLASTRFKTP